MGRWACTAVHIATHLCSSRLFNAIKTVNFHDFCFISNQSTEHKTHPLSHIDICRHRDGQHFTRLHRALRRLLRLQVKDVLGCLVNLQIGAIALNLVSNESSDLPPHLTRLHPPSKLKGNIAGTNLGEACARLPSASALFCGRFRSVWACSLRNWYQTKGLELANIRLAYSTHLK